MSDAATGTVRTYGLVQQREADDETSVNLEELLLRGYTVVRGLYDAGESAAWKRRVDTVYERQEATFSRAGLEGIGDADVARAPLLHDDTFIDMATHPKLLDLMRRALGDYFILNVQNAIINRHGRPHHQASWHRDLPYQNFVSSKPLAISALVTLDDFTTTTGGTQVLPFTHKTEYLPSAAYIERNSLTPPAEAGSAIVFDAMLFHRAGTNIGTSDRRGVNHVYSVPVLKQNYDFPAALGPAERFDELRQRLLGYTSRVPADDQAWRRARVARHK